MHAQTREQAQKENCEENQQGRLALQGAGQCITESTARASKTNTLLVTGKYK